MLRKEAKLGPGPGSEPGVSLSPPSSPLSLSGVRLLVAGASEASAPVYGCRQYPGS